MTADGTAIELVARTVYKRWLKTKAGKFITLTIEEPIKRRSNNQNSYWWGYVIPRIAERCGYAPHEHEALHDELMRVLVGLRPDCHPALQIRVSSADLTTADFNRLIEAVQVFAAEKLGLVIEDPDPEYAFRKAAGNGRTKAAPRQSARHH